MLGASRCRRISGVLLAMLTASLLIRSGQLQVSVRVIGEVTAVQGRDVTLTCNVETKEDVSQLTWQKKMDPNNENLLTYRAGREPTYLTPFAQDRIRILGKGTFDVGDILIRDVRLSDEGTYVCGFSTHPSGIQEREIKLQVHVPPTVSIYLPPIPVQVLPRNVAECTAAAAKPPAYITWVCSSLPYNVNTTDIVHQNKTVTRTSQLWMIPTRSLSGQNATCLVFQQEEVQQEVNFTLDNILYAPQDVSITTHRSKEGILQLRCTASANPPANYTWRRENVSHPGNVTLQPSDVLMVPDTDPDVLDQYVCETNNSVGGERGIIYIYTIAPGCRCHYLAVIGVLVPLLLLCAGLLWCWTRGIIREENKYVDVPLEAEETREQMQDRMNREAEERSLEASGKSIALVTSFEKEQSHLDPSKDLKEAEDA